MTDTVLASLYELRDHAYLLALRMCGNAADAEDIVQEALLRALKASDIPGAPRTRAWFLTVVANTARNHRVTSRHRCERERIATMRQIQESVSPEQTAEQRELQNLLVRELEALESPLREAVSLRYEQGLSYSECAEALGVAEPTLRVQTSRGVQVLRERLSRRFAGLTAPAIIGALGLGFGIKATPALAASLQGTIAAFQASLKPAAVLGGAKVSLALAIKLTLACVALIFLGMFALPQFWSGSRVSTNQAASAVKKGAVETAPQRVFPGASIKLGNLLDTKVSVRLLHDYLPEALSEINRSLPRERPVRITWPQALQQSPYAGATFEMKNAPLADVLDALAKDLNAKWKCSGDVIVFWREMPAAERTAALARLRDKTLTPAARLEACEKLSDSGDIFVARDVILAILELDPSEAQSLWNRLDDLLLYGNFSNQSDGVYCARVFANDRDLKSKVEKYVRAIKDPKHYPFLLCMALQTFDSKFEELATLPRDGKEGEAAAASYFMAYCSSEVYRERMAKLLDSKNHTVRLMAADGLAQLSDERALKPLLELAVAQGEKGDHEFADISAKSIRLLSNYPRAETRIALLGMLRDTKRRISRANEDPEFGEYVAYVLAAIADDTCKATLLKLLQDPNLELQYRAAVCLARMRDLRAGPVLLSLLTNKNWRPQETVDDGEQAWFSSMPDRIQETLIELNDSSLIDALCHLVEHGENIKLKGGGEMLSPKSQKAAIILGAMRDRTATQRLISIFNAHRDNFKPGLRPIDEPRPKNYAATHALQGLARSREPEAEEFLLKLLESPDKRFSDAAATQLSRARSPRLFERVFARLSAPDAETRADAVYFMIGSHNPKVADKIIQMLTDDPDPHVRAKAAGIAYGGETYWKRNPLALVRKAILAEKDSGAKIEMLAKLANGSWDIETHRVLQKLASDDANLDVRMAALEKMLRWLTQESVSMVLPFLKLEQPEELRWRAARMALTGRSISEYPDILKRQIYSALAESAEKDPSAAVRLSAVYSLNQDRMNQETVKVVTHLAEVEKNEQILRKITKALKGQDLRSSRGPFREDDDEDTPRGNQKAQAIKPPKPPQEEF